MGKGILKGNKGYWSLPQLKRIHKKDLSNITPELYSVALHPLGTEARPR